MPQLHGFRQLGMRLVQELDNGYNEGRRYPLKKHYDRALPRRLQLWSKAGYDIESNQLPFPLNTLLECMQYAHIFCHTMSSFG